MTIIRVRYYRGLCTRCYYVAARLVRLGIKTWSQMETEGLILPKGQSRRVK